MLLRLYLSLLPPRRDLKQRFFIRTTKRRSRMPATQTARKCICLGGSRPLVSSVPRSRQGAEMKFRLRRLIAHIKLLGGMCLVTVSVAYAQQPGQQGQQQQNPDRPSTLIVSVRMPDGSPFDLPAVVNLYSFSGAPAGIGTFRTGTAEFDHLPPGSYTLEVVAAGYEKLTEPVQIITAGERQQTGRCEKASGESFSRRSLESGRELFVGNVLRPNERFGQSQGVLGEGNTDLSAPRFFPGGARATSSAKLEWPGSG